MTSSRHLRSNESIDWEKKRLVLQSIIFTRIIWLLFIHFTPVSPVITGDVPHSSGICFIQLFRWETYKTTYINGQNTKSRTRNVYAMRHSDPLLCELLNYLNRKGEFLSYRKISVNEVKLRKRSSSLSSYLYECFSRSLSCSQLFV